MNTSLTDITLVIDRSGSMGPLRKDTIHGINTFVSDQKKAPGSATITAYKFDHEFETMIVTRNIKDCPELTEETYQPRGNTALLDAMGRAITLTGARLSRMPESERPGKVVMVIITDGFENFSREYTRPQVFDMIKHQREVYKWEFVYLGANQDAIEEATKVGISAANSMTTAANSVGTQSMYYSISDNLTKLRAGTKRSMAFEKKDYDLQTQAGATNNPTGNVS